MTSFLARLGHFETRLAGVQTAAWSSGAVLKRREWVCSACRTANVRSARLEFLLSRRFFASHARRLDTFESLRSTALYAGNNEAVEFEAALQEQRLHHLKNVPSKSIESRWSEEGVLEEYDENEQDHDATTEEESYELRELFKFDHDSELSIALQQRDAELLTRCIESATLKKDYKFLSNLPPDVFTEILSVLESVQLDVQRFAEAQKDIGYSLTKEIGFKTTANVAGKCIKTLLSAIKLRRLQDRSNLTLEHCTILLRCARDLGNIRFAEIIWKITQSERLTADTACWNYYMGATLWNGRHRMRGKRMLRVTSYHMSARQNENLGLAFQNYRVGSGGLKEQVMANFGKMLQQGVVANEESFVIVILSAAREGDVAMVKSILRSGWKIDVDGIMAGTDESEIPPKRLPANSPVHPTVNLIKAVAHAFGINNEVPTALRVVDFMARHYKMEIDMETWDALFEWTFVSSRYRAGQKSRKDGSMTGQLPLQSVLNLWNTMINAPYNVQPTMDMYNRLMRNLADRDSPYEMVEKMEEGRMVQEQSSARVDILARKVDEEISKHLATSPNTAPPRAILKLCRELELGELIRSRDAAYLGRWLRLCLRASISKIRNEGYYSDPVYAGEWALRRVPRLLWEWRDFAPSRLVVETIGGTLEFDLRNSTEMRDWTAKQTTRRQKINDILARVNAKSWSSSETQEPVIREHVKPFDAEHRLHDAEDFLKGRYKRNAYLDKAN
ncbi:Hypothetical protein R9X50_00267800 [Acrodontium crateriforme]|uniref:Uncharacterized protein n=1 Tax=Acrodontium crateriforme TaxID=150365 RepID=A0AAQ3M1P5_9PEZI|nr:Hypothetical protein R9X50_00267800 [Acrodontium crateriforme]